MDTGTRRVVEIESLAEFDQVSSGARRMRGWRIQSVDLSDRTDVLLRLEPAGSLLLGCTLSERAEQHLRDGGALLFPAIPDVPFDPYRGSLYTPEELYEGVRTAAYETTPDARTYAWSRGRSDVAQTLAAALHDHAIDDAFEEAVSDRSTVGVMGAHTTPRGGEAYRRAAELGRGLARAGHLVVTGGGPGAMEAANLGAFLADSDDASLGRALKRLAKVRGFAPSVTSWVRVALAVREAVVDSGRGTESLGIPTWFYGHEPPNVFAAKIAKYFQNSVREDTLLRHCTAGIVFLPGAAGTVQEVFQDACENYYASDGVVAPMVLVGAKHWTETVPVWPLLTSLAEGRAMKRFIHLVDAPEDAVQAVAGDRIEDPAD